jgi:hypothetical protein
MDKVQPQMEKTIKQRFTDPQTDSPATNLRPTLQNRNSMKQGTPTPALELTKNPKGHMAGQHTPPAKPHNPEQSPTIPTYTCTNKLTIKHSPSLTTTHGVLCLVFGVVLWLCWFCWLFL